MSYHPANSERFSKASEVGLGWSLYGTGGLIYREINKYSGIPTDLYYYNFFGKSGKFTFSQDSSGVRHLTKLTNDKLMISFAPSANDFKFTVTDVDGVSYIFDTRDKAYAYVGAMEFNYAGAYYLTEVLDTGMQQLFTLVYVEDIYTQPGKYATVIPVKSLKISSISSAFGTISFQYTIDSSLRKKDSDQFKLNVLELKTTSGKVIQKFGFESSSSPFVYPLGYMPVPPDPCGHSHVQNKRVLSKLLKYSKTNTFQQTEFFYGQAITGNWTLPLGLCFSNEEENPAYLGQGLLKRIKLPTGAEIKYQYEPHQYYVNKNSSYYFTNNAPPNAVLDREAQYYEDVGEFPFNFTGGTVLGLFNLPHNPDNSEGASYLAYTFDVHSYYDNPILPEGQQGSVNFSLVGGIQTPQGVKFLPGNQSFQINGTGGTGYVVIKRIRYKSLPLPNYSTGKGVRIKKIEYYDNNTIIPDQTKQYSYQNFSDNQMPSGFLNDFGNQNSVVYKNVKEVTGNQAGYTKYFFKAMNDYPENINTDSAAVTNSNLRYGSLKYVNILDKGLHYKTQIFNNDNVKKAEEYSEFEFSETEAATYTTGYELETIGRNALITKQITSSTAFYSDGSRTEVTESVRDTRDLNVISQKTTGADGIVTMQTTTYPWSLVLTDPRLWNANIRSFPLITETKRNGTLISKQETKYENTSHFFPTSQVSYLPDNPAQGVKNISYDIYDDKGNLVQFTEFPDVGTGKSTTVIWGYNKTVPIAKVEGAKFSEIPAALISSIVSASNSDANATSAQEAATEWALVEALNLFRTNTAMKDFMISCYTYDPLVGVTKMIPPTGLMETYQYDTYNRLHRVLDVNGVALKEYQYNYKQ
ncbi:hypothetical protein H1R16_10415 [Marnyiella aurantia]|uniref:RHS repeat protein n=1 Tax=Marnyiella aurantia TaxID=2758037 RepID=A0A7D7QK89_9FLAO|nr:hypothetical protein [Marnyiella aurantia]MBA5246531.1 hypothetical protein [Marnyiella aurantia]QMS98105.1 hypothetical protein H1R16_10415 [Marnyiella aurantia]